MRYTFSYSETTEKGFSSGFERIKKSRYQYLDLVRNNPTLCFSVLSVINRASQPNLNNLHLNSFPQTSRTNKLFEESCLGCFGAETIGYLQLLHKICTLIEPPQTF